MSTKIIRLFIEIDKFAENGKNTSRMRLLTKATTVYCYTLCEERSVERNAEIGRFLYLVASIHFIVSYGVFSEFHWEIQSTMATRAQLEQFWVGKKGRIQSVSLKSYSSIWDHSRISVCMWHKQQTTFKAAFIEHNISLRSCTHQFVSGFGFRLYCGVFFAHTNTHELTSFSSAIAIENDISSSFM